MQPISRNDTHYDTRTIWFHWLTALLIVSQWIGAKTIDLWPKGAPQVDARSVHIALGVLLGLLVLSRIAWRMTGGRRLPDADRGILALLAKAMHWGFYLLILTAVGLGLSLVGLRGTSFFNLFMLPTIADGTRQTFRALRGNHELLANIILIAAGLHAGAALIHQYALRDGGAGADDSGVAVNYTSVVKASGL